MRLRKKLTTIIFFNLFSLTGLFLTSCDNEEALIGLQEEDQILVRLISANKMSKPSKTNISSLISSSGLDFPLSQMKYDVQIWEITYETLYKGSNIVASGMAYIPLGDGEEFSYLTFAHGTIAANNEAPSELSMVDIQTFLFAAMASTGLITVVPDLIGFGSSKEIMHPYYVEETSALAVIDGLRAVRELLKQEEINSDEELYLSGYSGGGYVTMATHKYIEDYDLEYFDLKASFPAAGGYDMKGVRDFFFDQEVYETPYFMAYIAESYRTYYDIDTSLAQQIFNEPYAQRIINIFDGLSDGSQINSQLNDTVAVLIAPGFLSEPDNEKYSEISQLFEQNSLLSWIPEIPMYLFHGDADITVPYQNTIDTYDAFLASGTSSEIITLTTFEGADHYTGFVPYLESFMNTIMKLEGK
ncbi:MAG: lipase family protein [Cyclobacteriaceae bacterium]|nr:lipase family protein [Cyclobacteriaceae bacterium]